MNLEVWFQQQDEVSVFLESSVLDSDEERFYETCLFALFAARQIANLRGDWVARTLAATLADIDVDHAAEHIRQKLGEVRLVPPSSSGGRKGFTAEFRPERRGFFKMHPRGFGMLGRGVQYYAPTSTVALLSYLLDRRADDDEYMHALAMTAKFVGHAGYDDAIGITSSATVAMQAAAAGWEFASDVQEDDEDGGVSEHSEPLPEVLVTGTKLAAEYGVDLPDLANHIIGELAAARPQDTDPDARWVFPEDALRAMCAVDFAAASMLRDPRLDEAFARSGGDADDGLAIADLREVTLRVLDDHGLTPVVDALFLLITTDDFSDAL